MLFLAIMGLIVFLLASFSVTLTHVKPVVVWKFLNTNYGPQRPGHHLRGR